MNNENNRSNGVFLSFLNMFATAVLGILYTPFVLRFLGQNEYGIYHLAVSIIAFLNILDMGMGTALVRYNTRARAMGKSDAEINGFFLIFYCLISACSLVVGIFLILGSPVFFESSFSFEEIRLLKINLTVLLINTVISFPASVFSSLIRAHEKFVLSNSLTLLNTILTKVVTVIFLYMGYKSVMIVVVTLICNILVIVYNVYFCIKKLNVHFCFCKQDRSFYQEIFSFSFFILLNILVDQLYSNTDNLIIGKLCGSAAVAVYGIGVTFQGYYVQFSTAVSSVFLPHLTMVSIKDDSIKEMSDIFLRIGRLQYILLSFILMGFIVFGQEFILYWAGDGFSDSYYIALIAMVPALIPLSQNLGISILQVLNKHKIRSVMYLFIAILNVVISIPLARRWGGIGAAIGTAIGNLLGQILFMNWYYSKRIGLDIKHYWTGLMLHLVKIIPGLVIFIFVDKLIVSENILELFMKIILGSIINVIYFYFIVLNSSEKQMIMQRFRGK